MDEHGLAAQRHSQTFRGPGSRVSKIASLGWNWFTWLARLPISEMSQSDIGSRFFFGPLLLVEIVDCFASSRLSKNMQVP